MRAAARRPPPGGHARRAHTGRCTAATAPPRTAAGATAIARPDTPPAAETAPRSEHDQPVAAALGLRELQRHHRDQQARARLEAVESAKAEQRRQRQYHEHRDAAARAPAGQRTPRRPYAPRHARRPPSGGHHSAAWCTFSEHRHRASPASAHCWVARRAPATRWRPACSDAGGRCARHHGLVHSASASRQRAAAPGHGRPESTRPAAPARSSRPDARSRAPTGPAATGASSSGRSRSARSPAARCSPAGAS